jgi:hypothetical protein
MNTRKFLRIVSMSMALAASALLSMGAAQAMEDSNLMVSRTNATAGLTNYTASIDLGTTNPAALWHQAYVRVAVPAMTYNTNTAATFQLTLQDSLDNSTFTATTPQIQCQFTGVTNAAGSGATNYYVPLPPRVARYIRFQQITPANSGNNTTSSNVYSLVVP